MTLPLFVYGSLCDPDVRARVLGARTDLTTCPAVLRGYARRTVPGFAHAFLVPAEPDTSVDGELILGLMDADYPILDAYEDVDDGLYLRAAVTVETADGPLAAWTYRGGPAIPS
jgi:hypothetical protein